MCTGYLAAQCALDPLYDSSCTGYAAAYLTQQCDYDPLYDVQCIGYQQAYFDYQCEMDSQYDSSCPNFVAALEDILDDGTEIDPIADALATPEVDLDIAIPEVPVVITEVPTEQETINADYEQTQGDMMKMEDDIEREIAELESEASEDNTNAPDMIGGGANQEDDIEKELAELKESADSDNKEDAPKPKTKNEKIRLLLAMKAIELTKKLEKEVNLEQNMIMQRQLLALISYVPGFDYNEKKLPQVNFYPPKPTVDHAYARWFLNDPNFGVMEDSQYNFK